MVCINATMTSDEICEILNTNKRNLKSIQARGKLEDRLIKAGYRLMKQLKEGRNNIYELEQITDITWNEYQTSRNISDNKKEDHTKYTEYRITSGLKEPRTQVISESMSDISSRTAKRYDDILVDSGAIKHIKTDVNFVATTVDVSNAVYKMLDKNNDIIYVGKATQLKSRIYYHSIDTKENDWFSNEVVKIEYIPFKEYGDCSLVEMYFICKLKPKHNKDFSDWNISIDIDEFNNYTWFDAELDKRSKIEYPVYEEGISHCKFVKILKERCDKIEYKD